MLAAANTGVGLLICRQGYFFMHHYIVCFKVGVINFLIIWYDVAATYLIYDVLDVTCQVVQVGW